MRVLSLTQRSENCFKSSSELQISYLICDSGMTLFGVDDAAALSLSLSVASKIYFYI